MDEVILKAYNQCIAATELSPEDIITMNDHIVAGIEAKTKVIRFHNGSSSQLIMVFHLPEHSMFVLMNKI